MKPWLRNLWLVATGGALALLIAVGFKAYWMFTHPVSPITNDGFSVVQIAYEDGQDVCELKNGEARLLPYGLYRVNIPEIGSSFLLFKNNRGAPVLRSVGGKLVVETDANSAVLKEELAEQ